MSSIFFELNNIYNISKGEMRNQKVRWALQNPSSSFFSIIFHFFSEIATYHAKNHPILFEKKSHKTDTKLSCFNQNLTNIFVSSGWVWFTAAYEKSIQQLTWPLRIRVRRHFTPFCHEKTKELPNVLLKCENV